MSTNYEVYLNSVNRLAATIVLKDEATCEIINNRLSALGWEIDAQAPRTWKYYLNLSGQYHGTNTMMTIVSMDDGTEIEFTRENRLIHTKTWREYQYGSRFYNELVEKYPNQEMLIDGILNPVDIDLAISADDHSILYYDRSLVEGRETNLIPKLQQWVIGIFTRYANEDYRINNSLFVATRLLILFMAMPDEIIQIRLENCRTRFAHSYHIKRYLASFGPLDQYYNEMNEFQRLYFYRDIRYLRRNNGKLETFDTLTKNVMTRRNFPMAEYLIQQNDSVIPEQFTPATQFFRRSINGIPSALGEDVKSTAQLLALEDSLAKNNPAEAVYAETYVPEAMELNLNSQASTKVLESNVLDLKESEPYTLTDILLNQWIYLADTNKYTSVVTLTLPDGGAAPQKLTMRDAYILFQYVYMLRSGWQMTIIPPLMAKRIRRIQLPTRQELRSIASYEMVDDAFIEEALRNNPTISAYVSVDAFVRVCMEIHDRMLTHRDLYVYRNDFYQYGEIKQMTDRFYADYPVDMDKGQSYVEWLGSRNISLEHYSPNELDEILQSLLSQATGKDLKITQSLKEVHAAMLGIMTQLSSYSVQFIQQINDEPVVMFDYPHARWHDLGGAGADDIRIQVPVTKPFGVTGRGKDTAFYDTSDVGIVGVESYSKHATAVEVGVEFELSGLNQYIEHGIIIGANVQALTVPTIDLSTVLTGQAINAYPEIPVRPIAELFDKVTTDDFTAP